ncbi:MAG: flagellar biosynthesis protein FlhB [Gemmatimonadales bacterium]
MAEQDNTETRTEDPTPRRRQKAREEGRIARSTELTAAAMLLSGTALLATVAGSAMGRHLLGLFEESPGWLAAEQSSLVGVVTLMRGLITRTALAMTPLGVGLVVLVIGVGLVQSRGVYSWKPVTPQLNRISPLAGFKRILGADAAINLVKSILKLVVLGLVTWSVLSAEWPKYVSLADSPASFVVDALESSVVRLALTVGVAFLAIGLLDYALQLFRVEQGLKMSRHEVLREHKEQEGDPQIKARIRQIARQRARRRMLTDVATADVVIANPTHVAVALKYDLALSGAPMVLAKGERKLAEKIKQIARNAGVPIVENRPLARALLAACTVGSPIPPAFYIAVAEILAYVYKIRRRLPSALAAATGAGAER